MIKNTVRVDTEKNQAISRNSVESLYKNVKKNQSPKHSSPL